MRPTVGKLLAATLLALCIGVQVLEATGQWDRTFQDTNDEAVIVVVVLCIGAGLAMAGAALTRLRPSRMTSAILLIHTTRSPRAIMRSPRAPSCDSPPVSLRI